MKYLIIVPDGLSDHPLEELNGKTPLEAARVPHFDYFAKIGRVGMVRHVPDKVNLFPHMALFSLMGFDPRQHSTGPGPLEAANLDLKLEENEVAFRMNFVSEAEGVLADPTAGRLTTREAKALIAFLNKKLASEFVRFFPIRGHRHLAVLKDSRGYDALSAVCADPETIVGKPIEAHLPKGSGQDLIKKLMFDAKLLLSDHEINQVRIDLGENPANLIWLLGQGPMPKLTKFKERFGGLNGAMISTSEFAKGFARLIGLTVMELPSTSVYPDYDYEAQAESMLELINEKDMVCVHLNVCENASRAGDLKQKVLAIEAIDHFIMNRVKMFYEKEKDVRILISPLISSPVQQKAYVRESVPYIIAGKNIVPDEIERYSESSAQLSQARLPEGWKLLGELIDEK